MIKNGFNAHKPDHVEKETLVDITSGVASFCLLPSSFDGVLNLDQWI